VAVLAGDLDHHDRDIFKMGRIRVDHEHLLTGAAGPCRFAKRPRDRRAYRV
jgi:hypothetical protein